MDSPFEKDFLVYIIFFMSADLWKKTTLKIQCWRPRAPVCDYTGSDLAQRGINIEQCAVHIVHLPPQLNFNC